MRTSLTLFALVGLATSPAFAQSLEGVWKPVQVVVDSGPDRGRHTSDVQPGQMIFTKHHYSMLYVQGFKARPIPSDSASQQELGQAFIPFTANAGTYERKGSTLTLHPTVAKHPRVMSGTVTMTINIRQKGDTLSGRVTGGPGAGTELTWVRIERR
jgi:hypothetical protein